MIRSWTLALALLGLAIQPASGAEELILRLAPEAEGPVWIGQRVNLNLDVLVQDGWAKLAKEPDLRIPGAYVLPLESQGTRLSETIDNASYTGQRYEISLFPQRSGPLEVPPHSVEVAVQRWGAGGGNRTDTLESPALIVEVRVPPGAEGIAGLVSTTDFDVTEEWEPDLRELQVGDAIRRTVVRSAADLSGMAFLPLPETAPDGVRAYGDAPQVNDDRNRGSLTGKRTESITYVFEKDGSIELPALTLTWWNLEKSRLERVELAAREVVIRPDPHAKAPEVDSPPDEGASPLIFLAPLLLALALVGWSFRERLTREWKARQEAREASETVHFQRFRQAALGGSDPRVVLDRLLRWIDVAEERPGRIDRFLEAFGDPEARQAAALLVNAAGAGAETPLPWDPPALTRSLARARQHWLRSRRAASTPPPLPPLNPGR